MSDQTTKIFDLAKKLTKGNALVVLSLDGALIERPLGGGGDVLRKLAPNIGGTEAALNAVLHAGFEAARVAADACAETAGQAAAHKERADKAETDLAETTMALQVATEAVRRLEASLAEASKEE